MRKRFLSLLLSVSLLLSLLSCMGLTATAAEGYSKATSLSVGDRVILVCENVSMELSSISTTSTKYGVGTAYSGAPGGILVFEVCAGYSSGTYAFKNGGKYLYWTSGNSLNLNATLSAKTSWTVTFDSSGNATVLNSSDSARQIWWNDGAPRFACYTGKSGVTGYSAVQIYKASGSACAHSTTSYSETTPPTCTEKGEGKYTCTACGYSWTVTVAATGHSYSFKVVNGSVKSHCAGCNDLQDVSMHTIAEAKAYTETSQVYHVKGVVTYIKGRTAYIEDGSHGLCVYFSSSVDLSALRLGDEIFVSSTMTTYKNLPELNNPTQYLLLSSGKTLPNTTSLSIGDILADASFEHLGKRVTLKNVTVGTINTTGYTALTDSSGNSISIYAAPEFSSDVKAGCKADVTAIISYFDDGFQLLVNPSTALTDVVKVGEGTAVEIETVPIATAKAGADEIYYQVEGIVTCMKGRQIFIQDETGGIVVYLSTMPTVAPCAVGDKIRVYGSFGNYDGVLELQYVDHTNPNFFSILSSGNQVVAQPVTIEELLTDSAIEYELFAEKVFLNDVSILEIDTNGTVLLWQDDYTIEIYTAPTLNEGCEVGAVVDVTATVAGYNFNYELVIVNADAITYGSRCTHGETMPVNEIAPSCTETGYSGDLYCTVCGAFVAEGQELPAAHTVVSLDRVEATCEAEGYTGQLYCEVCGLTLETGSVIPALGHDFAVDEVIAPTCLFGGYTLYTCSRCEISSEEDPEPPTGHSCTYVDLGSTHSYTCTTCGEQGEEEHSYADGFCTDCGAMVPVEQFPVDETIVIRHTLNLASDISINFVVPTASLTGYDAFYLECVRSTYEGNTLTGEETMSIDIPTVNGAFYYFTLTGINATQMGDEIRATLYMVKGEELYRSNVDIYSVATYAYTQLNKAEMTASLKTLCADLLRYGSAAQSFKAYRTDRLVDSQMTAEHRSYLSDMEAVTFGKNAVQHGDLTGATVTWKGKSLVMDSKVTLRFIFDASAYTGDVNGLSLRISYTDYSGKAVTTTLTGPNVYNAANSWYAFDFDGLLAAELRSVVSVAVYAENTRVSETMSYSADTYGNGKTGALLTVCKAMIAYSDSAKAYFAG